MNAPVAAPQFLDEAAVRALLRMEDLIPAMERALIDFSAGRVQQPVRSILEIAQHRGFMGVMPAVYGDVMGAKLVNFYPENGTRGLPTHLAMIVLSRAETGEPLAVMDGRLITEMRTAAVSAVATKLLASPNARSLADPWQRRASSSAFSGSIAGEEVRRGSGLEPRCRERGEACERDRREVDGG